MQISRFIFCFSFVYLYDIIVLEKEVLHLQQGAKKYGKFIEK